MVVDNVALAFYKPVNPHSHRSRVSLSDVCLESYTVHKHFGNESII